MDSDWPNGFGELTHMRGRARDLLTLNDPQDARVVAEDKIEIWATIRREIASITTGRLNETAQALVGGRGGRNLRGEIARLFAEEKQAGTLLHVLLDDFSGASLVAGWAWTQWMPDSFQRRRERGGITAGKAGQMEGVCIGFSPGSSAFSSDGTVNTAVQSSVSVPALPNPDDPSGWHPLAEQEGPGMRRARRMDIWFDPLLRMDIGFQDSATSPAGGRVAVHEYRVFASADPDTFELLSIDADPRVLPYKECPGAVLNVERLLGLELSDFRNEVPKELAGTLGCTHLNDVLRSLSDAPQLAAQLRHNLERAVPA